VFAAEPNIQRKGERTLQFQRVPKINTEEVSRMQPSLVLQRIAPLCSAAIGVSLFAATAAAQVANYPAKPVRIVIPFTAGSPVELPGRPIAQRLSETLHQQFLIDNRPGASGTIATDYVAKSPKDGYTILMTNCSHSSNPAYYKKLPYDTLNDFQTITQTNVTYGNILVVHPTVPSKTVKEFIALAKASPGKLHYASAGVGSPPHVTGALFASMAGISLTHVAYKGTSVAFNDVLGGYVEVMFASPPFTLPFAQAGKVRVLGIGGPRRSPQYPDVPTFHEAGLTGYNYTCYHGMFVPTGTPPEIVRKIHSEVAKILQVPEVRKFYADNGIIPVGSTPEEFRQFLEKDIPRMAEIAKRVGIKPQ
jgi:tripartite-type tricarboxylate transporter receptor subunit TctC